MKTPRHRALLTTVLLLTFACKQNVSDDEGSVDSLTQLCVDNCMKAECVGITITPDYEAYCESRCEMNMAEVEEDNCTPEYEAVLMCLDETSCDMYSLWYEREANAPCADLETQLTNSCPDISLREIE